VKQNVELSDTAMSAIMGGDSRGGETMNKFAGKKRVGSRPKIEHSTPKELTAEIAELRQEQASDRDWAKEIQEQLNELDRDGKS
jgi:hypothetical protein